MRKKDNQTSDATRFQVFELTMDNPEDQDELNRRYHKRSEPGKIPATTNGRSAQAKSTTAPVRKKKKGA